MKSVRRFYVLYYFVSESIHEWVHLQNKVQKC